MSEVDQEVEVGLNAVSAQLEDDLPEATAPTEAPMPKNLGKEPESKIVSAPDPEPVKDEKPDIEKIEPSTEPKRWILSDGQQAAEYVQKELTFFRKIEFFSMIGKTVSQAMEGEEGLTVVGMLDAVTGGRPTLEESDLASADTFVAGIAKITAYVPDFLKDCYCIWLDVPKKERAWAREAMDGLTDDEAIEIIETFIDQNAEALADFFRETAPRLLNKVSARFASES